MHHLDLFAGIGGFSLAADMVWKNVEHTFVEIDPFCQAVLRKHWPESEIHGDIKQFITDTESERRGKERLSIKRPEERFARIDLLTGGFPCQPFSAAGKRKGTADDRYLWPAMFRIIQLYKPTWIIAENVRGLVTWSEGLVLEQVCADLESEGYEVQSLIIPACGVNAPHRRERVWIVGERINTNNNGRSKYNKTAQVQPVRWTEATPSVSSQQDWDRLWREVAIATCHVSLDDGLPRRMGGSTISAARWRKEALKAYGNSIVPQVAVKIMQAISAS